MKRVAVALLLLVLLTACSPTAIDLLEGIVSAAEAVVPALLAGTPDAIFVDTALSIADSLLMKGVTIAGLQQATQQLSVISAISPVVTPVVKAISAFTMAYNAGSPIAGLITPVTARSFAEPGPTPKTVKPLTAKDAKKIQQLKARIQVARAKIKALKAK